MTINWIRKPASAPGNMTFNQIMPKAFFFTSLLISHPWNAGYWLRKLYNSMNSSIIWKITSRTFDMKAFEWFKVPTFSPLKDWKAINFVNFSYPEDSKMICNTYPNLKSWFWASIQQVGDLVAFQVMWAWKVLYNANFQVCIAKHYVFSSSLTRSEFIESRFLPRHLNSEVIL